MPEVSVVIPSFNCAEFLGDALDSVLAQTMQSFEIIVVDDGSTDRTAEVIARYTSDPRIRYIYQDNLGLPGARNTGAKAAQSRFLAFLDADDMLALDALGTMHAALSLSGAAWCVIDLLKVCSARREVHRTEIPAGDLFYAILKDDYIRRGMFFRRDEFMAAGMYDQQMKNREDWDLNIRMLEQGRAFHYVPQPLYLYSWREGSITTGNPAKMLFYTEEVLRKHHKRLADAGDAKAVKIYAENMWGLARNHFHRARNIPKMFRCMRESLAYDPSPRRLFHPVVHQFHRLTAS